MRRLLLVVIVGLLTVPVPALAQDAGGFIEGSIIDGVTGSPARQSESGAPSNGVNAFDLSGNRVGASDPMNGDGRFRIGPLPAGSYKLQYVDSYSEYDTEWWPDRAGFAGADPVEVLEGQETPGIDFLVDRVVAPGAGIEGRLTIAETGRPVPAGFRLQLELHDVVPPLPPGDGGPGQWTGWRVAWTDDDGRYRLGPVAAGTYKILFVDGSWFAFEGVGCPCRRPDGSPAMLMSWWSDKADFATADSVEIRANEVTVLNFSLRQVGEIPQPDLPTEPETTNLPFTGGGVTVLLLFASVLVVVGLGFLSSDRRPRGVRSPTGPARTRKGSVLGGGS